MSRYISNILLILFSAVAVIPEAYAAENQEDNAAVNKVANTSETKAIPVASKSGDGSDLILTDTIKVESVGTVNLDSTMVINHTDDAHGDAAIDRKQPVYQGTYINLDLYNPLATLWNGGRFEVMVSADVSLWHRLFPVVELGFMSMHPTNDAFDHKTYGVFAKAGALYNFLNTKKERKRDHILAVGVRYGYSNVTYQTTNASVSVDYFKENAIMSSDKMVANYGWVEFVAICRVQVYKDFFMGISGVLKAFQHTYKTCPVYPTYIPGFGKNSDGVFNFGIEYTVTYRIPSKKLRVFREESGL